MGFRYDMQNKSSQSQAIVRQRDKEEQRREEERRKKQAEEVKCESIKNNGDYQSVIFTKNNNRLLELRISGTAIVNGPCGLIDEDITKWLCNTGMKFVEEVKAFEILMITSYDVIDKKLITNWDSLRKEIKASE